MKGNTITPRGIIVSPYRKPNVFVRIFRKIFERFRHYYRYKEEI